MFASSSGWRLGIRPSLFSEDWVDGDLSLPGGKWHHVGGFDMSRPLVRSSDMVRAGFSLRIRLTLLC